MLSCQMIPLLSVGWDPVVGQALGQVWVPVLAPECSKAPPSHLFASRNSSDCLRWITLLECTSATVTRMQSQILQLLRSSTQTLQSCRCRAWLLCGWGVTLA